MKRFDAFFPTKIFALVLFSLGFFLVHGQESRTEKEIVIIKKTIDENGNEVVEKIVIDGDEAISFDMDDLDIDIDEIAEIDVRVKVETEQGRDGKERIIINGKEINPDDFDWMNLSEDDIQIDIQGPCKGMFFFGEDESDRKAYLGVVMSMEKENNEPGIVTITEVMDDSPAEKAGLRAGDILRSIDGESIEDVDDVVDIINDYEAGDELEISYVRNGKLKTTEAELAAPNGIFFGNEDNPFLHKGHRYHFKNLEKNDRWSFMNQTGPPYMGVEIEDMDDNSGILITRVNDESPAKKAGIRNGDIIQKLNGQSIEDTDELIDAIQEMEIGDEINVEYRRDGKVQTKSLLLEERVTNIFGKCDTGKRFKEKDIEIIIEEMKQGENGEIENVIIEGIGGNNNLDLNDIDVYPNPTEKEVTLSFSTQVKGGPVEVKVSDISGKQIFRDYVGDFSGSYTETIDLGNQPDGVYILTIIQNGKSWTETIALNRR